MKKRAHVIPAASVESRILTIREQKVILDSDLAAIYGVTHPSGSTSRSNETSDGFHVILYSI